MQAYTRLCVGTGKPHLMHYMPIHTRIRMLKVYCVCIVCSTNDVGALKMAHVGVSIVNDPDFETKVSTFTCLCNGILI